MKQFRTSVSAACGAAALALAMNAGAESGDPAGGSQVTESPAQQPGELVDTPSEEKLMGYGTDGIAEDVENYSVDIRSNLGAPEEGESPSTVQPTFGKLDSDGDGYLTRDEAEPFDADWWLGTDVNGDDRIDSSEFSAFESTTPEP